MENRVIDESEKNMDQNVSVIKDLWKEILLFKEINLIFLSKVNYAWMFIWKQRRKGVFSILVGASKQKNYFIQSGFVKDYIKNGYINWSGFWVCT